MNTEANHNRRMANEARFLNRLDRLEAKIEKANMVGHLVREGKKVFYFYAAERITRHALGGVYTMKLLSSTDLAIANAIKSGSLRLVDREGRYGSFVAIEDAMPWAECEGLPYVERES